MASSAPDFSMVEVGAILSSKGLQRERGRGTASQRA
jgi:hypothetical protein